MEIIKSCDILTKEEYLKSTYELIEKSRKLDSTVIPHTKEELLYRYDKSCIIINNNIIVGHLSLYKTKIKELLNLNLGEIGSVIIDPEYRGKGFGKKIIDKGIEEFGFKYDGIIGATVNSIMVKILEEKGFDKIKFSLSYYNEGKKYLSQFMDGGEKEFSNRAKCLLLENKDNFKKDILELIN